MNLARPTSSILLISSLICLLLLVPSVALSQGDLAGRRGEVPWWNPSWQNRTPILISPHDGPYQDIQVRIDLDEGIDPHFNWDAEGKDLRFVYYDSLAGEYEVFDHWLMTNRVTHGAWFACCDFNGYISYHTPAATYYTTIRPNAVRHVADHDRTYFTYGDFSRDPAVRYFDHDTKTISEVAIPGRTRIPDDAHGNPSLLVDEDGYVYLFYGAHGHPIQMRRSISPESLDERSDEYLIEASASYPQPYQIAPSTIIVSYRRAHSNGTHPWCYRVSTDRGETWSPSEDIVYSETDAIYAITEVGAERPVRDFHMALNPFDYGTLKYPNVYYLFSEDSLSTFMLRDGTSIGEPPFTLPELDLVYDSGENTSHVNDLALDSEGNPYILFSVGPWDHHAAPATGEWRVARHDGNDWQTSNVAPCDHLFDRGCIVIRDGMPLRVYLPIADDFHDGGEMTEYSSYDDGETWVPTDQVTEDSEHSHNYAVKVLNSDPEFEVMWSYGSSDSSDAHDYPGASELVLFGTEGAIGTLDYGSASAFVRVPELDADKSIYMYYGNSGAVDNSSFAQTMQTSYARLPDGELDSDLLIEWLIEEGSGDTVHDQSEYGNDGIVSLPGSAWRHGGSTYERRYDISYPGSILHLDSDVLNYVTVSELAGPLAIDELTIEIWFALEDARLQSLMRSGPPNHNFWIFIMQNKINFYVNADGYYGGLFESQTISDYQWHHLVALYDGREMIVYLDGIKSSMSIPQTGSITWAGEDLRLGEFYQQYADAGIDEVRLYSRALSESEIIARYHKMMSSDVEVRIGADPAPVDEFVDGTLSIGPASPNPLHESTQVEYRLRERAPVSIGVFDASGRRVRRLLSGESVAAGPHAIDWDARNDLGRHVPAGLYFMKISAGREAEKSRLVVVK